MTLRISKLAFLDIIGLSIKPLSIQVHACSISPVKSDFCSTTIFLSSISRTKTLKHKHFESFVKQFISNECKIDMNDILITEAKFKPRVKMDSLYIIISQDLVRYTDLYPNKKEVNEDIQFYYVFIPKKPKESRKDLMARKRNIIDNLRPILVSMYMEKPTITTTEEN